jgi:hypothetical protein
MNMEIVACARGWLGTRFHHQGRVKKTATHAGGVDCLGLLIGIASELNLKGKDNLPLYLADKTSYPHYPDVKPLMEALKGDEEQLPDTLIQAFEGIDKTPAYRGLAYAGTCIIQPGVEYKSVRWQV